MKYEVRIKEHNIGYVTVEADSKKSAEELAYEEYQNGNAFWRDTEIEYEVIQKPRERGDAR